MAENIYRQYIEEFGCKPKKPEHLISFSKKKGCKLSWKDAKYLLTNGAIADNNNIKPHIDVSTTKMNIQIQQTRNKNIQNIASNNSHSYCYCGKIMKRHPDDTAKQPRCCQNCYDLYPNCDLYWCLDVECDHIRTNSFGFAVCYQCLQRLKGPPKHSSELLKLSLDITKMKMAEKKQKHQHINEYLIRAEISQQKVTNYFKKSEFSKSVHNELVQCYQNIKNGALQYIQASIDRQHIGKTGSYFSPEEKEANEINTTEYDLVACAHRIKKQLALYNKYYDDLSKIKFIQLFHTNSYSLTLLMNDFMHLWEQHDSDQSLDILDFVQCNNSQCRSTKRRFLSQKLYKNATLKHFIRKYNISYSDIVLLEYFDLIHSYFQHIHQTQNQFNSTETFNKFGSIINIDAVDCKQPSKTQISGTFSFGKKFWYWKYFREYPTYIANFKYNSLKQEMLTNEYCCIELNQFSLTLQKALKLIQTNKARQIKAMWNGANNMYEIPADLPLTTSHMMVLLFYCNYFQVQGQFKKHATRKKLGCPNEDWVNDVMPRHKKVANFFKLLTEIVIFFGEIAPTDLVLYHGLNVQLLFNQFCPVFEAAISTTTDVHTAYTFCKKKGVILGLSPSNTAGDLFFNVECFSAYPEQKERLFAKANGLNIVDIRVSPHIYGTNNTLNMMALRLFDNIFGDGNGANFFIIAMGKQRRKTQQRLAVFLNRYQKKTSSVMANKIISEYVFDLFCCLVDKKMNCKSKALYVIESDFSCLSTNLQHQLKQLMALFKQKYGVGIEFIEEYILHISGDDLIDFKRLPILYGGRETYPCLGNNIEFCPIISKASYGLPKFTGFGILIVSADVTVDVFFSFVVEEANYSQNVVSKLGIKQNVPVNVASFRNDLLHKMSCVTIKFGLRIKETNKN